MVLSLPDVLTTSLVLLTGLYLVGLAAVLFLAPTRATRFLGGFAGSARAHYAELLVRFLVGAAFVSAAPRLRGTAFVAGFGWILLITTAALLIIPWQWHRRVALRAVPLAMRHASLIGLAALAGGGLVLFVVLARIVG